MERFFVRVKSGLYLRLELNIIITLLTEGGQGGLGGRGIKCKYSRRCKIVGLACKADGQTEASRGPTGNKGRHGQS